MTYRERRERRAERLKGWADKRDEKAEERHGAAHAAIANIPAGQPVLVGHHSEQGHRRTLEKHDDAMRASVEHSAKAEEMRSKAGNIESALDRSIYDDDPDAIERLRAKLEGLEAERDAIKAFNLSCRKGEPDGSLAPLSRRRDVGSQYMSKDGQFPSYVLSNLGGNITRARKRLERLERRQKREVA